MPPAARTAGPAPSTPRLASRAPPALSPTTSPMRSARGAVSAGCSWTTLCTAALLLHADAQQQRCPTQEAASAPAAYGGCVCGRASRRTSSLCAQWVLAPPLQSALLKLLAHLYDALLAPTSVAAICVPPAPDTPSTPMLAAYARAIACPRKSPMQNAPPVVGAGAGRGLPALQPAWVPLSRGACHTAGGSSGGGASDCLVGQEPLLTGPCAAHIPAVVCLAGQELLTGGTSCTDCPAGTVNPTPGGTCSTTCTAPKVANQARTECGGCWACVALLPAVCIEGACRKQAATCRG